MPFDKDDPDFKSYVKQAIADAVSAVRQDAEEAVKGLKDKRDELLTEVRELKKGRTVDPEDHAKLQDQLLKMKDQIAEIQVDADKATKKLLAERDDISKQLQGEVGANHKLLIDTALTDALVKSGVDAGYLPYVKAKLLTEAKVVQQGEQRKAMVGDKEMATAIAEWASSDEAKAFIKAATNSGGAATGGKHGSDVKQVNVGDDKAFGLNLEEIAKGDSGKVRLVGTS